MILIDVVTGEEGKDLRRTTELENSIQLLLSSGAVEETRIRHGWLLLIDPLCWPESKRRSMEAIRRFTQTRLGQDVDKFYKQTAVGGSVRSLTKVEIPQ